MLLKNLKNKNILLWGLGTEGAAVLDYLLQHNLGGNIRIYSDKPFELPEKYKEMSAYFGDELQELLPQMDVIIKSPGVSAYRDEIVRAKEQGVAVTSSSDIFLDEIRTNQPQCKVIGVSGSKGKSTSVSAMYHMMKALGLNVGLGGNIGKPMIELIDEQYDYAVCEFSSYQAADLHNSPHLAMFTNLYYVHSDWHRGHENYCRDKIRLIAHQKDGDVFFVNDRNEQLKEYCAPYKGKNKKFYNQPQNFHAEGKELYWQDELLLNINELKISGNHNLDNLAGVFSILHELGVDIRTAAEALKTFEPLEHRLQKVAVHNGVLFINDSISTAPEAAIGGMKSFDEDLALISGGQYLEQNYDDYARYVQENPKVKMVCALYQSGPYLAEAIRKYVTRPDFVLLEPQTLEEAVAKANEALTADKGGIVLFSPTAPSFGFYKNFVERGRHFIGIVKELIKRT